MPPHHHHDDDLDFDPDYISKTQQKKAMDRLQAIGERLTEMTPGQRKRLPLSETLRDALDQLPNLRSHEAIRRHKQLIGKLMRHEDEDALLQALNQRQQPQLERQLSLWVERLLSQGENVIGDLLRQFPAAERHPLRQYLRAARHEAETQPDEQKARQRLLTYLREVARLSD